MKFTFILLFSSAMVLSTGSTFGQKVPPGGYQNRLPESWSEKPSAKPEPAAKPVPAPVIGDATAMGGDVEEPRVEGEEDRTSKVPRSQAVAPTKPSHAKAAATRHHAKKNGAHHKNGKKGGHHKASADRAESAAAADGAKPAAAPHHKHGKKSKKSKPVS